MEPRIRQRRNVGESGFWGRFCYQSPWFGFALFALFAVPCMFFCKSEPYCSMMISKVTPAQVQFFDRSASLVWLIAIAITTAVTRSPPLAFADAQVAAPLVLFPLAGRRFAGRIARSCDEDSPDWTSADDYGRCSAGCRGCCRRPTLRELPERSAQRTKAAVKLSEKIIECGRYLAGAFRPNPHAPGHPSILPTTCGNRPSRDGLLRQV